MPIMMAREITWQYAIDVEEMWNWNRTFKGDGNRGLSTWGQDYKYYTTGTAIVIYLVLTPV
jgi:hypothetical protein